MEPSLRNVKYRKTNCTKLISFKAARTQELEVNCRFEGLALGKEVSQLIAHGFQCTVLAPG